MKFPFSYQRIRAVARKEFLHILRDPRSLALALALPMVMLLLFGYALTLDIDRVPLMILDRSQTPESRELIADFLGSRYFALAGYTDQNRVLDDSLASKKALAALVLPNDFAVSLNKGRQTKVQLLLDGADTNNATLALGYAESVIEAAERRWNVRVQKRFGVMSPLVAIDIRPRAWYNPDMESRNIIIPGLITVILMIIAALLTPLSVAREWETGTMEQLISTPVRAPELILGKLGPYFVIGMLDVLIAVVVGKYLFHVPMRGSPVLLFSLSALYLLAGLSAGMLISVLTRNQLLASQLATVISFLPSLILSGFLAPIAFMPKFIQFLTSLFPARYFMEILRGVYMKGTGLEILWPQAAFLGVFTLVLLGLTLVKFRKSLD